MKTMFVLLAIYQNQEWYGNDDHSIGRWKNKWSHEEAVVALPNKFTVDGFVAPELAPGSNEYWRGINPTLKVVEISATRLEAILDGYEPEFDDCDIELSFYAECTEYEAKAALGYKNTQ